MNPSRRLIVSGGRIEARYFMVDDLLTESGAAHDGFLGSRVVVSGETKTKRFRTVDYGQTH